METLREQAVHNSCPLHLPRAESHPDSEGHPPSHGHGLPGLQPQGPGGCTPPLEQAAGEQASGCQQAGHLFYQHEPGPGLVSARQESLVIRKDTAGLP